MSIVNSVLMAALLGGGLAAPAQTTAPVATGSTQGSAPAAISPTASSAQAASAAATADSATRGSQRGNGSGSTGGGSGRPAAGITGVPRYHAGSHGPAGTPAPNATASVSVTGDTNGDGRPDESATLPGIATFRSGVRPGTPIQVRLLAPVDSGHVKNGDTVRGFLAAPLGTAPAGAPVDLTVVAAAAAGQIGSAGELSLQVVSINGAPILSEVITATGEEGRKELPDAAPERGTEAVFTPDKPLTLPAS